MFNLLGRQPARSASTVLAALALFAVYALVIGRILVLAGPAGMNPLVMARLSREHGATRFWDQNPVFEQFDGYDGQFYYYIARDPLLLSGDVSFLDTPAYRYQRILLPAFAWLLGLGQAAAIGWSLLAVNVLSLSVGCVAAARLFDYFGASRWWLLAYGLNPGFLLGVAQDLAEPLALALVTAGILALLTGRHGTAVIALTLAVLARETTLLVALGVAAFYLLRERRPRRALAYGLPLAVFAGWQVVVLWRVGVLPAGEAGQLLVVPGVGLYQTLRLLLGLEPGASVSNLAGNDRLASAVGLIAQGCAALLAVASFRLRKLLRWQLALQGAFVLSAGEPIWRDVVSFPRDAMLLFFFFLVVVLAERAPYRQFARRRARAPSSSAMGPTTK